MYNLLKFLSFLIQKLTIELLLISFILIDKLSPGRSLCSVYFWIATIVHDQDFFNGCFFRLNQSWRWFLHMIMRVSLFRNYLFFILFPSLFNKMPHVYRIDFLPRAFSLIASWRTPIWFKLFKVFWFWMMGELCCRKMLLSWWARLTWVSIRFEDFLSNIFLFRIRSLDLFFFWFEILLNLSDLFPHSFSLFFTFIFCFGFCFKFFVRFLEGTFLYRILCTSNFNVHSTLWIAFWYSLGNWMLFRNSRYW